MERRKFLTGTLASLAAGTALVKLASAEETALVVNQPVVLGQPEYQIPNLFGCDGIIYLRAFEGPNKSDEFVPVGHLTSITVSRTMIEYESWHGTAVYTPGLSRANITFEGSLK